MTTELLTEYLMRNWWLWLICAAVMFYSVYSLVKYYSLRRKVLEEKKMLEKKLADLKVEYAEKVKKLRERVAINPLKEGKNK